MKTQTKHKNESIRILKGLCILVCCIVWLVSAVFYWNRRYPFFRMTDLWYLHSAETILDPAYFSAVSVYFHFAPLLFLVFFVTVILPEAFHNSLHNRKTARLYICFAALCILGGCLMMIGCCTEIPYYLQTLYPSMDFSRFVQLSDLIYPQFTPVCILLSIITVLSAEFRRKQKIKAGSLILTFAVCMFTGIMIAAGSCLLLAMLKNYLPKAVTMVEGFCYTLASSSSMCLIGLVLAPIIEETAFRGLIQHHLAAYFPPWCAVLTASLLFGLWHRNPGQFVYTFFFGLAAGSVYEITGKLRWTMIIHFFMNLSAILVFSNSEECIFGTLPFMNAIYDSMIALSPLTAFLLLLAIIVMMTVMIRLLAKQIRKS